MRLLLIITILNCSIPLTAKGFGDPISLSEPIKLSGYDLLIFADSSGNQDIATVSALDQSSFTGYSDALKLKYNTVYWIKFSLQNNDPDKPNWIMDFERNDLVETYVRGPGYNFEKLKTGYLVPSSQKQLGKWNVTSLTLEPFKTYEVFIRLEQAAHDHDLDLMIRDNLTWTKTLTFKVLLDVLFQGILLIMTLYALLVHAFSRDKAYLNFGLYLLFISVFFLFTSGLLRDYITPEYPGMTLYCMLSLLIVPKFYYQFLQEFVNTPRLIPKINKIMMIVVKADVVIFFITTIFFFLTDNFYLVSRITQLAILVNLMVAFVAIYFLLKRRNEMVMYFIYGTTIMLIGSTVDGIMWDTNTTWGNFSRIGFVIEILFFSLGLGKRMQLYERQKRNAQDTLIQQLKLNSDLINQQKAQLEEKVKERTKELMQAKNDAERAGRAKTDFLSVMSHEIRTPMNAVVGITHLLLENNPTPEQQENLNSLKYSAEHLMTLINDILDYSKIESGKIDLERTDFDLRELIKGINYIFRPKTQSKGINFTISMDPAIHPVLVGDPMRLTQVLHNLVSNAIKFTEKGKVELQLTLKSETKDYTTINFSVSDTGAGIPKERIPKIFDHFTQAGSETTRKYGGTGLGLTITKAILEMYSAEIEVESKPGKGSKFTFDLKLRKGKVSTTSQDGDMPLVEDISDLSGIRVLAVDDNNINLLILKKFLLKWNIDTVLAENGHGALKKVKEQEFDMVLLDLQMPEIDGYEVARQIREMSGSWYQSMPIIALSADTLSNVYDKVLNAGMNDFLAKPFNPNELQKLLQKYCKMSVFR